MYRNMKYWRFVPYILLQIHKEMSDNVEVPLPIMTIHSIMNLLDKDFQTMDLNLLKWSKDNVKNIEK